MFLMIGGILSPVPHENRNFSRWDMASLWIGIIVSIPSYYLAGSLVDLGMAWWQGVATIVIGNTITLAVLVSAGHPGTRYGISFPVLLRSAFGVCGAHVPALLRAFVSCGWCGIETWIGGQAIFLLLPSSVTQPSRFAQTLPWLGTSLLELSCFLIFLLAQLAILWKGMGAIRALEKFSSPILIILIGSLFGWAYSKAGGIGEMLPTKSHLTPSEFWSVFLPSLTATISSWSPLAISIADFTRYCRSQSDQILGQLGLPVYVGLYTFFGLAITSATEVIYGRVISNPIELLTAFNGTFAVILAVFGISLAIITTNIPASFVAPANVFVSFSPSTFSFAGGCLVTGVCGVAFQPWRILGSSENFVYTWLVGYSMIIGPITGIVLTDYYLLRRMVLDVNGLYSADPLGPYYYCNGYSVAALGALVVSVVPAVPGFLYKVGIVKEIPGVFVTVYDNAWFFGVLCSAIWYWILSCLLGRENGSRIATAAHSMLDPSHHT